MNANELIEAIRDAGAATNAEVKATLEDGEALGRILGLAPLNPNSGVSVATHDEAQGIVKDAHDFVVKSLKLADLKEAANLPEVATVAGHMVNLDWQENFHLDGWYAEVPQSVVQELEKGNVSMVNVEKELARYGDSARYIKDSFGETYLCIYKDAI